MTTSRLDINMEGRLEELERVADLIEAHAAARNWPDGWAMKFNICLDELITNVVSYGYEDSNAADHEIKVSITETSDQVEVVLQDDGAAFDPVSEAPDPDLDSSAEDRQVGGLGIHFVRNFMDEVTWERRGDFNLTRLIMRGLDSDEG